MPGDRIRQLTERVRNGLAQRATAKSEEENASPDQQKRRSGRANSLLETGPRVPPESGPHEKKKR